MDSINKQQEEKNREDLQATEAWQKVKEMVENAGSCFFCTKISSKDMITTRPMAVQKVDDHGHCWFLSASDSHKNADIDQDPSVQLFFQGSKHSDFLTLYGVATISQDKGKIDELWNPILKTWFTGGKDDPRITVIEFVPRDGYYWDTKHGQLVAFAKQLAGAVMGKTLDDSIEGKLKL
ncbi:pyridoxamine 5'-phosphate oxidase family protein [Terrimonas sp. NA20]|uniref:Pyridoxamine 5'-phosphate oxidase family protein n=1 Tax=Terrimonas ginsenosidimutans TaxID=2908004 RepID=A0ABS9KLY8_9BACT|nr:pyridoxamine 5'-phosphate oxidase family protein [Terrimonas ginsenosidimutans]MCG2613341.1 pyridoxamine 5'-phosphate oxidase family protein [Terrimonas ginsenosidimutans]